MLYRYREQYLSKKFTERNKEINTISVIIPCFNHSKYLNDALNSILRQTKKPDELILIDDNSTDNTYELLNQFYEKYSSEYRILIKKNDSNIGQSATINYGVSLASSDIIMILNDDDYLMHDAIQHTINIYNANPDIYLLGSKSLYVYRQEHLDNLKKSALSLVENKDFLIRKIQQDEVRNFIDGREIDMAHSGCSFLKVAWEVVGGYISKINRRVIMYSDRDFQLRVNSVFPIAIVENAAFSFWRIDSSVDQGVFS